MKKNMSNFALEGDAFIIKNYNNTIPFASFLPGIAGLWGKPMWCFYVNRAQCISSFGFEDKNGAIVEFNAANKAYRQTPQQGFRTFIKIKNNNKIKFYEPFSRHNRGSEQIMKILPYSITIEDTNLSAGIKVSVTYFTLPGENVPALVRRVTVKNISNNMIDMEILDGLPVMQPYGIGDHMLKNVSRLAEGWFSGVEMSPKMQAAVYKLKIEPSDEPETKFIKAGNFYFSICRDGNNIKKLPIVVDNEEIFGNADDFSNPEKYYIDKKFTWDKKLISGNKSASAMCYSTGRIKIGKEINIYTLAGTIEDTKNLDRFLSGVLKNGYMDKKEKENRHVIRNITDTILTKSNDEKFDLYTRQTYLDNSLRGGYPVVLEGMNTTEREVYYAYSRIHGDMEREYNNFVIKSSYFSQGTGNYRDINQNRRSDLYFNTEINDYLIKYYYNLIQLDGFNPLKVKETRFTLKNEKIAGKVISDKSIIEFMKRPFTLGDLFLLLERKGKTDKKYLSNILKQIISLCVKTEEADFGVGYWIDHWHYNTDLLEVYLSVFPERIDNLLFKNKDFTFYDTDIYVKNRDEKYVNYKGKVRQLESVGNDKNKKDLINSRKTYPNVVRTLYGKGKIFKTTLVVKLLSIIANKYASLDPEGIGIEMESDKPNWYDALNGLPALLGSSSCETYELKRLITFLIEAIAGPGEIMVYDELYYFLNKLTDITERKQDNYFFWNETHNAKEEYRKKVRFGISGKEKKLDYKKIEKILNNFLGRINKGLTKIEKKDYLSSYFINDAVKYKELNAKDEKGRHYVKPLKFKQKPLPLFLEGYVHRLRINNDPETAYKIYKEIKQSKLYDAKLKMYKVNASIEKEPYEIGRNKIFTAGWLENESIWTHMEYKYLLELLRNGLYKEYYKELDNTLICRLDPAIYGRSILENVSFMVSSAHPEKALWGRGFVSRLSGATAEFINMWVLMTSGKNPFKVTENGKLIFSLSPALSKTLFTDKKQEIEYFDRNSRLKKIKLPESSFAFCCFNKTLIIYRNMKKKDTFGPDAVKPVKYIIEYETGQKEIIRNNFCETKYAQKIRKGEVDKITVELS